MYKGKFDAKNRGKLPAASAPEAQPVKAARKLPEEPQQPQQPGSKPTEKPVVPVSPAPEKPMLTQEDIAPARMELPAEPQSEAQAQPSQEPFQPKKEKKAKKAKRGPRPGTVIFYTLYFLLILGFCGAVYYAYGLLHDWLVNFQAAQPATKCEEVFQNLFADPDWAELYVQAGIQDTTYEGCEAFVSYMENKLGDTELTYTETSAGLSGNKKYYVKSGSENIGFFLLSGEEQTENGIPHWELASIELFYSRMDDVTVQKMAGHTVYVNGIALDDSFTVRSTYTVAEEYLPDNVSGLRTETQYLTGLLVEPQIVVLDENGQAQDVVYDAENDVYSAVPADSTGGTITSDEEKVVIKSGETYALYMIEKASAETLLKYYDKNSNVYQAITNMRMWMQNCNGYEFANQSVTNYYRYSDTLFSAKVHMDLNVTRTNNTVKTYTVDTTLFFENQKGSWKCIEMTNVDVLNQVDEVRITFMNENVELSSQLYATSIRQLPVPVISAPEGKVFDGWYRETLDADGNKTYDLVFAGDPSGVVAIPDGYELEPMVLYALFTDAQAEGTDGTEAQQ